MSQLENENIASLTSATSSLPEEKTFIPTLKEEDELLEMSEDFDFENFQVVRREFFAHLSEPTVSFKNCKITINSACLSKFPDTMYAQALVSDSKKILALRPCEEGARDSFLWCKFDKNGKRVPKTTTCKIFFAKLVSLMGWNPNYRYKMLGKIIRSGEEFLILFDLNATEMYQRTVKDDGKIRTSRTPIFPAEWQDQFGLPVEEHQKLLQVNIFDGYTVFGVQERKENVPTAELTIENIPEGGENV